MVILTVVYNPIWAPFSCSHLNLIPLWVVNFYSQVTGGNPGVGYVIQSIASIIGIIQ